MDTRLAELRRMLDEDPGDAFVQYALALELEKKGEPQQAADYLRRLVDTNPAYLASYYQLGRLLHSTGNQEEAIRIILSGIRIAIQQQNRHTLAELRFLLEEAGGEEQ